jgi:hypothetical protein
MYMPRRRRSLSGGLSSGLRTKIPQTVGSTLTKSFREKITMTEGKEEFYKKAEEALRRSGYQYYSEKDIAGIGSAHSSKPDYIAVKDGIVIIGEIKSPKEGPKSAIWRQIQKGDSEEFKAVRLDVAKREAAGEVSKEIGGHEIIIRGQIPDYIEKIGKTYDLPSSIPDGGRILAGYTFSLQEQENVEQALKNCGKAIHERIDTGNGSVSCIFQFK